MSGRLSFRGAAPEEAVALGPPITIKTAAAAAGAACASASPAATAPKRACKDDDNDDDDGNNSWTASILALLPAPFRYWWARLERVAGGPKRLRTLMLAFMAIKFVFGLACLVFFYTSSSSSSSSASGAQPPAVVASDSGSSTPTPLPYRLAGNGAAATGLAIGVISGSGPAQQRRVRLLQETWATSLDPTQDGLLVFSDTTDGAVPSVGLEGTGASWAGAQRRFFPALAFLRRAFPGAAWYVLVDDDTFLVPLNLKAALARRDPSQAWYLGRTMFVRPNSGVEKGQGEGEEEEEKKKRGEAAAAAEEEQGQGQGGQRNPSSSSSSLLLPFAHGGSGICLSWGLMAAFSPHVEREAAAAAAAPASGSSSACHGRTGYGDGDLAWCLHRHLGVRLSHEPCLHSSGPWARTAAEAALDAAFFLSGDSGDSAAADDAAPPCSFHQALRAEGAEGEGAGRADGAGDEQVWAWHREYNVGGAGEGVKEEEEEEER